jgi:hypothetical protein
MNEVEWVEKRLGPQRAELRGVNEVMSVLNNGQQVGSRLTQGFGTSSSIGGEEDRPRESRVLRNKNRSHTCHYRYWRGEMNRCPKTSTLLSHGTHIAVSSSSQLGSNQD